MKTFYLYLIAPLIMLLAFLYTPGVGYFAAQKQIAAKVARQQAEQEAQEAAKRKEIERKAEEDARERQAEREKADREKTEKREREYQEIVDRLRADIAQYSGEADQLQSEAQNLDAELAKLRNQKETDNRQTFDLAKQVELSKIERRTAELEIQRMVEMVAMRLNASPLSAPPLPAPSAPSR